MKVFIGKYSGYCPGVKRAIKILDKVLSDSLTDDSTKNIYTLGEIIHNPKVVNSYQDKGVGIIKDIEKLKHGDTIIIRSHGISPKVKDTLKFKDINIVDATCPFVSKAHEIAKYLSDEGYFIVLIGEKDHPEVDGIAGNIKPGNFVIIENEIEIRNLGCINKIALLSQTTQTDSNFNSICQKLFSIFSYEIRIFKTICRTTQLRQNEALKMASKNDIVIVVGGRSSANTRHLKELAASIQKNTYQIEDSSEVKKEWFRADDRVVVLSGASTPYHDLENVKDKIESFF